MDDRKSRLQDGLERLAKAARAGAIPGGSIENGVLKIDRLTSAVPEEADAMVLDLYGRLPAVRITDLMQEVDDDTRFTEAFTHLRTGVPCKDRIGLLNVLLAEGLNLGLSKMAEATNSHDYFQLSRLSRWHIESDAINRALAVIIKGQAALPMAQSLGWWHHSFKLRSVLPSNAARKGDEPYQCEIRVRTGAQSLYPRL